MKRNIIEIDEELCNGCGICVSACHEGALQMIAGKAKLITDSYCDGLGACLPECPTGAITIIERDADEFDEAAVLIKQVAEHNKHNTNSSEQTTSQTPTAAKQTAEKTYEPCACPGSMARSLEKSANTNKQDTQVSTEAKQVQQVQYVEKVPESQLRQWPVQIKLVPIRAPYFQNAHLLVAADCTAFAYANIHNDFMKDKITIIGCPKLDEGDYSDKLAAILANNDIESVHVLRMEVPCCGGMTNAVKQALQKSGKMIPWQVTTISAGGEILSGSF